MLKQALKLYINASFLFYSVLLIDTPDMPQALGGSHHQTAPGVPIILFHRLHLTSSSLTQALKLYINASFLFYPGV